MARFNCLSTDLLYEIFDYLIFTDIFRAFFNLRKYINDAIQAYPASINLSRTIDQNAVKHYPFSCRALIVSNFESQKNYLNVFDLNFQSIRAIQFQYVECVILKEFLEKLPLTQLESITIESLDKKYHSNNIEYDIWSLITIAGQNKLRYLQAPFIIVGSNIEQFVFDLPTLRYAIFKDISAVEILAFMQHAPNLRSFIGRIHEWEFDNYLTDVRLFNLKHLNLQIKNCHSFEALHQVLSVCPGLTNLTLRFWINMDNKWMVNAKDWQLLIEKCVPHLIYLTIRLFRFVQIECNLDLEDTFDLSEYWLQRKPNFDVKYMEV